MNSRVNSSMRAHLLLFLMVILSFAGYGQKLETKTNRSFALGGRSTYSAFSKDGRGLGTGGQFRIQFNKRLNTEWFADYISINANSQARSEYFHIGWSVMFYPSTENLTKLRLKPYILAGHCFDFNRVTAFSDKSISNSRWGSAVQAGFGTHINLKDRFDISVSSQYMIHLTRDFDTNLRPGATSFETEGGPTLQGHLLTTLSVNYKLIQW